MLPREDDFGLFMCALCDAGFGNINDYRYNSLFHRHGPDTGLFMCPLCDAGFRDINDYRYHSLFHRYGALYLTSCCLKSSNIRRVICDHQRIKPGCHIIQPLSKQQVPGLFNHLIQLVEDPIDPFSWPVEDISHD